MNKKRRNGYIAFGTILLFSAVWVGSGSGWLHPLPKLMRFSGVSDEMMIDQAKGFGSDYTRRGRKVVKDPSAKANSLLNIKSGETGIFRLKSMPTGNALAQFNGDVMKGEPPAIPILSGLAGKTVMVNALEQAFRNGGDVIACVSDQQVTNYSAKDFQVKVEVVGKQEPVDDLRVEIRCKNSKSNTELSVYGGFGMVFRLPEPEGGWMVVFRGKDEAVSASEAY